jgi:hypothetical protein
LGKLPPHRCILLTHPIHERLEPRVATERCQQGVVDGGQFVGPSSIDGLFEPLKRLLRLALSGVGGGQRVGQHRVLIPLFD